MLSQATFRERSKKIPVDEIDAIPDQMKSKWLAVIFNVLSTKIKKPFSSHGCSLETSVPGIIFIIVIIIATHCLWASRSIWDLEKSNARAAHESRHESEGRSLARGHLRVSRFARRTTEKESSIATRIASYATLLAACCHYKDSEIRDIFSLLVTWSITFSNSVI